MTTEQREMKKCIYYITEWNPDGTPKALVWSPDIQAAAEAAERKRRQEIRRRAKPMQAYVEWAKTHGIWSDDAP